MHEWTKELGSKVVQKPEGEVARQPRQEVARQPRGEVSRQAKLFQPTQPIPKPICDRSGQPDNKHEVFVDKGKTSWSQEIKEKSCHEELCTSDRTGRPVNDTVAVQDDPQVYHEAGTLNIDD